MGKMGIFPQISQAIILLMRGDIHRLLNADTRCCYKPAAPDPCLLGIFLPQMEGSGWAGKSRTREKRRSQQTAWLCAQRTNEELWSGSLHMTSVARAAHQD